jgi:transposase
MLGKIRALGLPIEGAYLNADSSFDTKAVRKLLWNRGIKPNIPENKRNRKQPKRGRKRHFNKEVYQKRFFSERSFAWIDTFRRLLVRFERKSAYFLGFHLIAYTLINLRKLSVKV